MHTACTLLSLPLSAHTQTQWRAHKAYKRWHPIIVMRTFFGRASLLTRVFHTWKTSVSQAVAARHLAFRTRHRALATVFTAWAGLHAAQERAKAALVAARRATAAKGAAGRVFAAWAAFADASVSVRLLARRVTLKRYWRSWAAAGRARAAHKRGCAAVCTVIAHWKGRRDRAAVAAIRAALAKVLHFALGKCFSYTLLCNSYIHLACSDVLQSYTRRHQQCCAVMSLPSYATCL
jgi:hypothetical protein